MFRMVFVHSGNLAGGVLWAIIGSVPFLVGSVGWTLWVILYYRLQRGPMTKSQSSCIMIMTGNMYQHAPTGGFWKPLPINH